jgi:hypothetical protein
MQCHRRIATAVAAMAATAVVVPAASAASGSGGQVVSATVLSAIAVAPTPVVLTDITPGSGYSTGSGNVVVTSTECYTLSVSDPSGGRLKSGANAFTSHLEWALGSGPFTALSATPVTVAANEPNTLGKAYSIAYQQPLAGENVPVGAYTTTATFTAASSSCS